MYLACWGLSQSPFAARNPLFYEGASHAEAAARLRYLERHARRGGYLTGRRGVGKSRVLGRFAGACRELGTPVAMIGAGGVSARELLWQLAGQWSLGPGPGDDLVRLHGRLADFAAALAWQRRTAVLLVDDAHLAGPDLQTQLLRLLALGGSGSAWLTLVIAAAPSLAPPAENLLDALDMHLDVEPWNEQETIGYVQHALVEAGCDRPIFDDEALGVLYQLTDGVPRQVNRLAEQALLGAAAEGLEAVDAGMVELAHESLAWTTAA